MLNARNAKIDELSSKILMLSRHADGAFRQSKHQQTAAAKDFAVFVVNVSIHLDRDDVLLFPTFGAASHPVHLSAGCRL